MFNAFKAFVQQNTNVTLVNDELTLYYVCICSPSTRLQASDILVPHVRPIYLTTQRDARSSGCYSKRLMPS